MNKLAARCIDINSDYCPCLLAETNHCVFCSHLQGKEVCDCNWTGICILYEKRWQSPKQRWRGEEALVRIEMETNLLRKEPVAENTYLLEFGVTDELARQLDHTGSFVFLRLPEDPPFFHFPVGVMKISDRQVQVVVETVGPKSARLVGSKTGRIFVRGPYFNGLFGQPWIDNLKSGKILLIAGGMGQPPAVPVARKLVQGGNAVTAVIAPGKTGKVFIGEELLAMGIEVQIVPSLRQVGLPFVRSLLANPAQRPDLIVSTGPDEQHYGVIAAMQSTGVNIPMAATNNATMCCGEGICGSCAKETRSGRIIKTCKVQTDFSDLVHD
ncbi:conserved hypothetical protein [Thermosinus carboxydivorans Nor1]|uniref:Oxidoreductase FAD-binding domain protein n=1 Tax=Thermosinus carboxydivorans Nor1 TaxID=401526 RepID=A1HTX3_9FIRM|nr:hypothetical protein [Thermosinus carboxydivorans]EAX46548.1 conserved hypothetical protein [Thermosinus carboxydivorans Nor1]